MRSVLALVILGVLATAAGSRADEAPISGTVKSVDPGGPSVTVESTAKGKTRQVVVHVKPDTKIVRFARPTEPGKAGFVEQTLALTDLKPGWVISVTARHEGDREVAESIKVVVER